MRNNIMGTVKCLKCEVETKYTFIDYILGGCAIETVIAIDFTLTNKPIHDPESLHHIPQTEYDNFYYDEDGKRHNAKNQYYKAIKRTLDIVNNYNADDYIPAYGFGAKLPPYYNSVSHLFALNGNIFDPEIEGVDGV